MKKRIRTTFPLVLAALAWLYTIHKGVCYLHWQIPSIMPMLLYLTVFSALFTLLACLVQKGKIRQSTSVLLFFGTLPVQLFALFFVSMFAAVEPTSNPAAYEYILHELNYPRNKLIAFFPEEIPEGAQEVSFWHNHPFLQGGERLSLAFTADEEYISSEIDRLSGEAKWVGAHSESKGLNNGISFQSFESMDEEGYTLPDDCTIYLLYSRPYRDFGDHIWNHGETCVVVISDEKNRILYQMDDW